MRVLVACEESQAVCKAFRAKGICVLETSHLLLVLFFS